MPLLNAKPPQLEGDFAPFHVESFFGWTIDSQHLCDALEANQGVGHRVDR
jgi:hypothetical protein